MPHAPFPRLGQDMVEGGPVRAVPGGPSFGETRAPSHSARRACGVVSRGSVGRRRPSEPHRITLTMNGAGCSRLPLFPPNSFRHGGHGRLSVNLMVNIVKRPEPVSGEAFPTVLNEICPRRGHRLHRNGRNIFLNKNVRCRFTRQCAWCKNIESVFVVV